jgi:hypothetical protein
MELSEPFEWKAMLHGPHSARGVLHQNESFPDFNWDLGFALLCESADMQFSISNARISFSK